MARSESLTEITLKVLAGAGNLSQPSSSPWPGSGKVRRRFIGRTGSPYRRLRRRLPPRRRSLLAARTDPLLGGFADGDPHRGLFCLGRLSQRETSPAGGNSSVRRLRSWMLRHRDVCGNGYAIVRLLPVRNGEGVLARIGTSLGRDPACCVPFRARPVYLDWGGGLVWFAAPPTETTHRAVEAAARAAGGNLDPDAGT